MSLKSKTSPTNTKGMFNQNFVLGLVSGIAIIALIGFVFLLVERNNNGMEKAENGGAPVAAVQPTQPTQPTAAAQPTAPSAPIPEVTSADHIRGNKDAAVTLVEYSDFQCPYCLRFTPTVEKALQEFPNDVRLVYRHFPLNSIHPNAQKSAEASECASEQWKFWEMHDKIFEQNAANNMSVAEWKQLASDMGLDTAKFNDCLDSDKYASLVQQNAAGGQAAGVRGTPATFVNGQLVSGAVPYEQLKAVIQSKLGK